MSRCAFITDAGMPQARRTGTSGNGFSCRCAPGYAILRKTKNNHSNRSESTDLWGTMQLPCPLSLPNANNNILYGYRKNKSPAAKSHFAAGHHLTPFSLHYSNPSTRMECTISRACASCLRSTPGYGKAALAINTKAVFRCSSRVCHLSKRSALFSLRWKCASISCMAIRLCAALAASRERRSGEALNARSR